MNETIEAIDVIIIYSVVSINSLAVIFNGLIIFSMICSKNIKSISNLLLALILFSDMFGSFGFFVYYTNRAWIHFELLRDIFQYIGSLTGIVLSLSICLLLSIHRYKIIKYPYDQNEKISNKKLVIIFFYTLFHYYLSCCC